MSGRARRREVKMKGRSPNLPSRSRLGLRSRAYHHCSHSAQVTGSRPVLFRSASTMTALLPLHCSQHRRGGCFQARGRGRTPGMLRARALQQRPLWASLQAARIGMTLLQVSFQKWPQDPKITCRCLSLSLSLSLSPPQCPPTKKCHLGPAGRFPKRQSGLAGLPYPVGLSCTHASQGSLLSPTPGQKGHAQLAGTDLSLDRQGRGLGSKATLASPFPASLTPRGPSRVRSPAARWPCKPW